MPAPLTKASRAAHSKLLRSLVAQAHELKSSLAGDPHADDIAQAAACAAPILAAHPETFRVAQDWLQTQLSPWEQQALTVAPSLPLPLPPSLCLSLSLAHLFEPFLHHFAKSTRKTRGVYFTPPEIATYIIQQIDRLLIDCFHLPEGLLTASQIPNPQPPASFLDPACGTGVFLLALIDHLAHHLGPSRWNAFVPDLLPRLVGLEILPPAAFLAKLNIALKLAETGYDFASPAKLNILTTDALTPNLQSAIWNPQSAIPILLGNPPFSSLTTHTNDWIASLVRGSADIRGYARAGDQHLGERKTWLHDDYVKFIRLAQWHIEQAGQGIVGFVTNHGYLDNATFRLMRQELLRVFPHIEIIDLHGNRKKYETAPAGTRDENVFGLDQGLAIGLFCRPPTPTSSVSEGSAPSRATYADLWGPRIDKLRRLAQSSLPATALTPAPPDYRFVPTPIRVPHPEYDSAWSLADAMPVNTTAPVTARDHFVIAFTRDELIARLQQFRDLSIPDDEIRARYFHRTRSSRYQSGDTRGWQLATARRLVAADPNWQEKITRCLYRPFDWRYIFWHPALIDWPRTEVTRHLTETRQSDGGMECRRDREIKKISCRLHPSVSPYLHLCLIARRQQLPTQPCTFFWISDGLALDGVIRSDNRGSESLFPLYLEGSKLENSTLNSEPGTWNANFPPAFIQQFSVATRLAWQSLGPGDLERTFGPEDLLAYMYALFHTPTYRDRYAASLRTAFPRIVPPKQAPVFTAMSRLGHELMNLHLLRSTHTANIASPPAPVLSTPYSEPSTASSPPYLSTPLLTQSLQSPALSPSFRIGGYDLPSKWLQPKHRSPADPAYHQIVSALTQTSAITQQLDRLFTGSLYCILLKSNDQASKAPIDRSSASIESMPPPPSREGP